ncbi:palindromic element RPE1 domain-containing protein [Candidatus Tisiphia endosymbiont of Ptychoptera albimana]|uniref:palindromic element RPE1 domain-containing protein n=1 Tax=Candidatus Tisiphia endosymbiont of Ptychoptera albimana TaxID=3066260 RepID=UPI00312CAAD8
MSQDILTVNTVTLVQEAFPLTKEVDNTESSSELGVSKTPQQVDDIISKLRENSLHVFEKYLRKEFFSTVAGNQGEVDITKDIFQIMCHSLLYNEQKGALSLFMTIKDIKKRLDEIETTSEGAKKINKFKEEIEQYRADVIKKLSTNEGIADIVTGRLQDDLVSMIVLRDSNEEARFSTKDIASEVTKYITIPDKVQTYMLKNGYGVSPSFKTVINRTGLKHFAVEINQGKKGGEWGYFDQEKFTSKNIHKFADSVNSIVTSMEIILLSIQKLKITKTTQSKKLIAKLLPVLADFNDTYLENNKDKIVVQLTANLTRKYSKWVDTSTKKLEKISKGITESYNKEKGIYIKEENTDSIDINDESSDISITFLEAIESQDEDHITDIDEPINQLDYDIEQQPVPTEIFHVVENYEETIEEEKIESITDVEELKNITITYPETREFQMDIATDQLSCDVEAVEQHDVEQQSSPMQESLTEFQDCNDQQEKTSSINIASDNLDNTEVTVLNEQHTVDSNQSDISPNDRGCDVATEASYINSTEATTVIDSTKSEIESLEANNRALSKLAYAEGFEGDASPRTAAYSNVREDSSTASTYKSPAEVEFRKSSNTELVESPMVISHISSWNIWAMWTAVKSYISSTLHEISDTVLTSIKQLDHHHYGSYDLDHPYKSHGLGEELMGENSALLESVKYFSNLVI